jgi:pre-mRNA-processing factor 6
MNRPNFGRPPPGYVAGLGRGAIGFTTRSDVGPARQAVGQSEEMIIGMGRGAGMPAPAPLQPPPTMTGGNFDSWSGYEGSLFSTTSYDNEDREADDILENIEKYMDGRRGETRKKIMEKELIKIKDEAPKYQEAFADLKRQLANVSREEWESIPDNVDRSNTRKKAERYTPTSDSMIDSSRMDGDTINFLDPDESADTSAPGMNSMQTPMTNLSELGEARKMNLGLKLDKMSNSVMGTSVVNKNGYLTDLNALKMNSATEINDIKKAKLLMKSVRKNNPDSAHGWISSARIEELDGKVDAAREIIGQACDKFPMNDDVWVEAARLMPPKEARQILVKSITNMPKSKKLWMAMANIEKDKTMKIKTLRKALNYISNDVELWKAAIELETHDEAKSLLYKAIE